MNRTAPSHIINLFFLRLPAFLTINGLFNIFVVFYYQTYAYVGLYWVFIIPFTVFFLIRELIDKKQHAIILQISAALFFLFLSSYTVSIINFTNAIYTELMILLMYSFLFNTYDFRESSSLYICGIFHIIVLIFSYQLQINELILPFIITLSINFLCYNICRHFWRLDILLRSHKTRNHSISYVERLRAHNIRLVVFYTTLLASVFVLSMMSYKPPKIVTYDLTPIWDALDRINIVRNIPQKYDESLDAEIIEAAEGRIVEMEPKEVTALPGRLRLLVIALAPLAALIISILLYRRTPRHKYADSEEDETYESEDFIKSKRTKKRLLHVATPNKKVRKMYVKKVNEHVNNGLILRVNSTAEKISAEINKTEDISLLNETYHYARYSGEEISIKDITKLKENGAFKKARSKSEI